MNTVVVAIVTFDGQIVFFFAFSWIVSFFFALRTHQRLHTSLKTCDCTLGLRIIKYKDKRVLHVAWGYKGDSLMYVRAGKTKGAFISGMKGVTTIEGHDCKRLCFITKETTLYGF